MSRDTQTVTDEHKLEARAAGIKVDVKAWFSAERTCVQWIHLAATAGGLALAIMSSGDAALWVTGALLLVPSIFFAAWGGVQYWRRSRGMLTPSEVCWPGPLQDRVGPAVAVGAVTVACVANTVIALYRAAAMRHEEAAPSTSQVHSATMALCLCIVAGLAAWCPAPPGLCRAIFRPTDQVVVVPLRAEPRAWLANERTFLSWANSASTLSVVAVGLTLASDAQPLRLVALLLVAPAAFFVLYAAITHYRRVQQPEARAPGALVDWRGPLCLLLVYSGAVLGNLARTLMRHFSATNDAFDFSLVPPS
jgi:uncharacterized membrane protein YidH (DUF202 family)